MKNTLYLCLTLCFCLLFGSCLTYEKKDVVYHIHKDGSVSIYVKYYNIMSDGRADYQRDIAVTEEEPEEEDTDTETGSASPDSAVVNDFRTLMRDYLDGTSIEPDFSSAMVVSKRLFEENGVLCGEMHLKFWNALDADLFVDQKNDLVIKHFSSLPDDIIATTGSYNGKTPLIVWKFRQKEMSFTQRKSLSSGGSFTTHSLLSYWKKATGN